MQYDSIPNDFSEGEIEALNSTLIPKSKNAHSDYATRYRVVDENGNEFLVISDNSRKDDMSDHLHVSQSSGEPLIANPTLIKTEMWPSGGGNLPQRAILTAMRELEEAQVVD